jgi:hypothetical protein
VEKLVAHCRCVYGPSKVVPLAISCVEVTATGITGAKTRTETAKDVV